MTAWMRAGDLGQPPAHQLGHQAAPHIDKTGLLVPTLVSSVVDLAKTQTGFPIQDNCVHCVLPMTQLTGHGNV